MNNEEINRRVEEICGHESEVETMPGGHEIVSPIPNYCGCLNAMAGAEAMLTDEQWDMYVRHLNEITEAPKSRSWTACIRLGVSATALQRATAFVRVHEGKEKQ